MNKKFDGKRLAKDILAKRVKENLTFRSIEHSTRGKLTKGALHKIEAQQATPGADMLAAVCNWLEVPVQRYFS